MSELVSLESVADQLVDLLLDSIIYEPSSDGFGGGYHFDCDARGLLCEALENAQRPARDLLMRVLEWYTDLHGPTPLLDVHPLMLEIERALLGDPA